MGVSVCTRRSDKDAFLPLGLLLIYPSEKPKKKHKKIPPKKVMHTMETGMGLENKDDTNWQQAQSGDLDEQTASTDANFQAGFHIFIINIKCICFLNLGMLLPLIFNT